MAGETVALQFSPADPVGRTPWGDEFRARSGARGTADLRAIRLERPEQRRQFERTLPVFARFPSLVAGRLVLNQDGAMYLVRSLLEAPTLGQTLSESPVELDPVGVLRALIAALVPLHEAGVPHGALHPDNIIGTGSEMRLLDPRPLELARGLDHFLPARIVGGAQGRLGTNLDYVAPEQREGAAPTPSSDLFAFGTIAHWLFTRRMPIGVVDPAAMAAVPDPWCDVVLQCLAQDPAQRPADARQVAAQVTSTPTPAIEPDADFVVLDERGCVPTVPPKVVAPVRTVVPPVRVARPAAVAARPAAAAAPPAAVASPAAVPAPAAAAAPPAVRVSPVRTAAAAEGEGEGRGLSPVLVPVLLFGGCLLLTGLSWFAVATWDLLPEFVRTHILSVATVALGFAGYRCNESEKRHAGVALGLVASVLLFVDAAYLIYHMQLSGVEPWIKAMGVIALLQLGAELYFGAAVFGGIAAIAYSIACLIAGFEWWSDTTLHTVLFLAGSGAVGQAAFLGLARANFSGAQPWAGVLPLFVVIALFVNFGHLIGPHPDPASAVVTTVGLGAALLGLRYAQREHLPGVRTYDLALTLGAVASLTLGPALFPLLRHNDVAWLAASTLAGVGALAWYVRPAGTGGKGAALGGEDTLWFVGGLFALLLAPAMLPMFQSGEVATVSLCLVISALTWAGGAWRRKLVARPEADLTEAAALLAFHFPLVVLSAMDSDSIGYAMTSVAGSALVMGVAWERRSKVSFLLSGAALVLMAVVQYVLKLRTAVPWYIAAIGLGVILLVVGVSLEQKRKEWVGKLQEWE